MEKVCIRLKWNVNLFSLRLYFYKNIYHYFYIYFGKRKTFTKRLAFKCVINSLNIITRVNTNIFFSGTGKNSYYYYFKKLCTFIRIYFYEIVQGFSMIKFRNTELIIVWIQSNYQIFSQIKTLFNYLK